MNYVTVANVEENLYHDSYFYAVRKYEDGTWEYALIGSTAFGGGSFSDPIDASDEDKAIYIKANELYGRLLGARIPRPGKPVIVPTGRKYKGAGTIEWIGNNFYDPREKVIKIDFDSGVSGIVPSHRVYPVLSDDLLAGLKEIPESLLEIVDKRGIAREILKVS